MLHICIVNEKLIQINQDLYFDLLTRCDQYLFHWYLDTVQFLQQSIDIRTPLPIDQFEHQLVKELSEKLEELQCSVGFYAYQRPHLLIAEPPKGYSVLDVVSEEVLEGLCD